MIDDIIFYFLGCKITQDLQWEQKLQRRRSRVCTSRGSRQITVLLHCGLIQECSPSFTQPRRWHFSTCASPGHWSLCRGWGCSIQNLGPQEQFVPSALGLSNKTQVHPLTPASRLTTTDVLQCSSPQCYTKFILIFLFLNRDHFALSPRQIP